MNALPTHFWSSSGYGAYYGYGCQTFAEFDYVQKAIKLGTSKDMYSGHIPTFIPPSLDLLEKTLNNLKFAIHK